ncbi:MAG: hypothetical protein JO301_01230 [Chitinophagaceae bacterium]|nr:hypothetical protein [Chitinophagaceae bacterium]
MKILGIILIVAGVLMCVFNSFSFTKEKTVVDLGPLQINKKEHHRMGWPVYAGIGVGVLGIALLAMDKKGK